LHTLCSEHTQPTHPVLATHFSNASFSLPERSNKSGHEPPSKNPDNNYCRYCRHCGHTIDKSWCKAKSNLFESAPSPVATTRESQGFVFTLSPVDFEAIVNQVLSYSGNAYSFVLSVLLGKSSS